VPRGDRSGAECNLFFANRNVFKLSYYSYAMNIDWKIVCDSKVFDNLKSQKEFGQVLALARAVTALDYVLSTWADGETPSSIRRRNNMFIFSCGILYEAFNLLDNMRATFKDNDDFKNGMQPFRTDPIALRIRDNHIKFVRHKGVFHFDWDEFKKMLSASPSQDCVFAVGHGDTKGEQYYILADAIVFDILLQWTGGTLTDYEKDAARLLTEVRDLSFRFTNEADKFISSCLMGWGFKMI